MVLELCEETDVSEGQLQECVNKKQELNSPNLTNREMENVVSTNNSEEESKTDQSENEERTFVSNLYCFMTERGTPIERIPHLGFKQINLWKIYKAVENLGGYDTVTARRLWKNVYDELGGSPGSTSAATCTRRHYERLVLPFERQLRGEEDKPLPPVKPRKQYRRTPENRGNKLESKKKRKIDRNECEEKVELDHHCDRGMCSHHSQWPISCDRQDTDQTPTAPCPRENTLQTLTPSEVISPLEKKKRLAQASLTVPASGSVHSGTELDRPSIIQLSNLSQSPACPSSTRTRHSSDGSPFPVSSPSSSFSRSPSPYSISSEDYIAVTSQKSPVKDTESRTPSRVSTVPTSEASSTEACKPFSCFPNSNELANRHRQHYKEFQLAGPAHSENGQRSLSSWSLHGKFSTRVTYRRLSSAASYNTKACWVPYASSFSKVLPRDACRSVSLQPAFNLHMPYYQHLLKRPTTDEAYLRKMPAASPLRFTDKKEKANTVLPKPLPTQQYLFHTHNSLPMSYLPALERPQADLTKQLKTLPLQPVLLPTHLTVPPANHSMHCPPVGTLFPGSYEAAFPSYPYPLPIWHPPAGYSMAGLQPYRSKCCETARSYHQDQGSQLFPVQFSSHPDQSHLSVTF